MFKLAILIFLSLSPILCTELDYNYNSREEPDFNSGKSKEKHHHFWESEFSHEENYEEVLDMEALGKKLSLYRQNMDLFYF